MKACVYVYSIMSNICNSTLCMNVPTRSFVYADYQFLCSDGIHLCTVTGLHEGTSPGMLFLHPRNCRGIGIIGVLVTIQVEFQILAALQTIF